jgi:hypothetical protein
VPTALLWPRAKNRLPKEPGYAVSRRQTPRPRPPGPSLRPTQAPLSFETEDKLCTLARAQLLNFSVLFGLHSEAAAAQYAAAYPGLGIGFVGVALAFGLTVVTMAYAVGHISGAHFNPAITIGLWTGGRTPTRDVIPYIVVQVAGAIAAAAVLKIVAEGHPGFVLGGFASNGFGDLSPGHYNLVSCAPSVFSVQETHPRRS